MKIHNDIAQGSADWHRLRSINFCASEAPAALGVSKYMTRSQLLDLKKSGQVLPVSDFQQRLFNEGHATESLAREIIESQIFDTLNPVTISKTVDGLNLLASLDGLSSDGKIIFEHKLWNEVLAKSVSAGIVPESHKWQLVHQLVVTSAEKVIFVVSDGTIENMVRCDFTLSMIDQDALIDGWKAFDSDLKNHVVTPSVNLPAISIDIGEVALNLHTPEILIEKIRQQAAKVGVFDISTEKGRIACNSHAASIIRCITPAINESKRLASSAKKIIANDLSFRKQYEVGVREIAAFHRRPLTELEQQQKEAEDKKAFEEAEKKRLAEEQAEKVRQAIIAKINSMQPSPQDLSSLELIETKRVQVANIIIDEMYGEFQQQANEVKIGVLVELQNATSDLIKAEKQAQLARFNEFKAKCEALNNNTHSVEYLMQQREKLSLVVPDLVVYCEHHADVCKLKFATLDKLNNELIPAAKQRAIDLAEKLKVESDNDFNPADIRIDVYRIGKSSGFSLEHPSAVRVTHLPTGITTESSGEHSEWKNKAKAIVLLKEKLANTKATENQKIDTVVALETVVPITIENHVEDNLDMVKISHTEYERLLWLTTPKPIETMPIDESVSGVLVEFENNETFFWQECIAVHTGGTRYYEDYLGCLIDGHALSWLPLPNHKN